MHLEALGSESGASEAKDKTGTKPSGHRQEGGLDTGRGVMLSGRQRAPLVFSSIGAVNPCSCVMQVLLFTSAALCFCYPSPIPMECLLPPPEKHPNAFPLGGRAQWLLGDSLLTSRRITGIMSLPPCSLPGPAEHRGFGGTRCGSRTCGSRMAPRWWPLSAFKGDGSFEPVVQILFECTSHILQPLLYCSEGAGEASVCRVLDKCDVVNAQNGGPSWGWEKWTDS